MKPNGKDFKYMRRCLVCGYTFETDDEERTACYFCTRRPIELINYKWCLNQAKKVNEVIGYNNDKAHCNGSGCKIRNDCYRYWLHKHATRAAMYFFGCPYNEETNSCKYFLDKGDRL